MKTFDLSILDNDLQNIFSKKVHEDSCFMFNLIGEKYQSDDIVNFYPNSVINKWLGTSFSDKTTLITNKFTCLKRCDENTYYEYYCKEYNPVSVEFRTIPNKKYRKYDSNNNLLYEVCLCVHSIDDSGFLLRVYNLTLEKANEIVMELIGLIDLMDLVSLDKLESYGKEQGYEIDRY